MEFQDFKLHFDGIVMDDDNLQTIYSKYNDLLKKQNEEIKILESKHITQKDRFIKQSIKLFKKSGGNGGKSLDNETRFKDEINTNNDYKKDVLIKCNIINDISNEDEINNWKAFKVNKEEECYVIQTDDWKQSKEGSGEKSPTPKSDICLRNLITNKMIGISLKSGEGRATSADIKETTAILDNVLKNNIEFLDNDKLKELVDSIKNSLLPTKLTNSKLNKREMDLLFKNNIEKFKQEYNNEYEWYIKLVDSCKTCNILWKNVCELFPHFKISIIKECLSGNYKFGNNIGKADFLIKVKDSSSTEINDIYDLHSTEENYIKYCMSIGNGNVFACKSSGSTLWMRFL